MHNFELTLRQYLIAHAPVEKWDWFQPVVTPKPTGPGDELDPARGFTELQRTAARAWRDDPCFDLSDNHPDLQQFEEDWKKYWNDLKAWKAEFARQSDIQWPAFWASEQIKFYDKTYGTGHSNHQ